MLRNRGLGALLLAEVISTTGSMMTWLALPWFVLTTTGSAARMTVVAAAEVTAFAIFGIPAGSFVARVGARRAMLMADGLRAPLMLLVPLLHWAGALHYVELVALAFAIGLLATPYMSAQRVVMPEMLGEDASAISKANALLQSATRGTTLLGPPLAGVLIGLIGAPSVLVVDALTFLASFLLVAALVRPASTPAPGEEAAGDQGMLAGLEYLRADRLLRSWAVALTLGDAAWQVVFVGIPVLVFAHYGGQAELAGLILGAFGCGAIVGNLVSYRAFEAQVPPRAMAVALLVQALPVATLALPVPGPLLVLALGLSGFGNGLVNPTIHATMVLRPPPAVRAQALSAMTTASAVGAPLALVAAAPAFATFGSRAVLAAAAAGQIAAMTLLAGSMLSWDGQPAAEPTSARGA